MSITLTSAMTTALGRRFYEPGVFVELGFTTPVRLHDRQGTKSWNSLSWLAADVAISGIAVENSVVQRCTIAITDSDNSIAQACRSETAGKPAKVWLFDNSATAAGDPVLLFDGVMSAPSGGDTRRVRIECAVQSIMLPRGLLAQLIPAYMFMPEGKEVCWGNGIVTASRRGEYA